MPLEGSIGFDGWSSSGASAPASRASVARVSTVGVSSLALSSESSPAASSSSSSSSSLSLSSPAAPSSSPSEPEPDSISEPLSEEDEDALPSSSLSSSAPRPSFSMSESESLDEFPSSRLNMRQSRRLNMVRGGGGGHGNEPTGFTNHASESHARRASSCQTRCGAVWPRECADAERAAAAALDPKTKKKSISRTT